MMKQEIDLDQELNRLDDTSRDINPCRELIVNNNRKDRYNFVTNGIVVNTKHVVNHIHYDRHPMNFL